MRKIKIYKILYFKYLLFLILFYSINGQSQTLEDYLVIAAKNNPEIKMAYAEFEAAMQIAPQVRSLPDPSLTMSAFGRMIETRIGSQEAQFTFMQMFPWFGTLTAKENAANLKAEAAFQKYINVKNEVFLEVKKMYGEIYEMDQMIKIEEKNLILLETYREISLNKFKNGKGAMVDVIRIDIKISESNTNIQLLRDQNLPFKIGFNSLLNREFDKFINSPDYLSIVEIQNTKNQDSLFSTNPKLLALDKQKAVYEAQQFIAKKEGYPMIGLGVDYSIIAKRNIPDFEMNGQDAMMPMITLTLPIFRKKYNAAEKEAALMIQATTYEKQAVENNLQASYNMAKFDLIKAKRLKELYKRQLISTNQAIELLLAAYSNSETDFQEVISMNQDLLMLQFAIITSNKNQFNAQSQIDYLLSKEE